MTCCIGLLPTTDPNLGTRGKSVRTPARGGSHQWREMCGFQQSGLSFSGHDNRIVDDLLYRTLSFRRHSDFLLLCGDPWQREGGKSLETLIHKAANGQSDTRPLLSTPYYQPDCTTDTNFSFSQVRWKSQMTSRSPELTTSLFRYYQLQSFHQSTGNPDNTSTSQELMTTLFR